ncbi:uncharacterized protein ColSpa_05712 [Colletotrichum spaethianum]|uniref:Uncharacterized protein n=1 Tax=Colletotrichum spaethianum TaxID=700344 RepID=A0AA37P653_9PEZI|nr:uncharacterized protein ColSpa_05712 [Colletotrichum spaethianum]GKT45531.1 hypothetical protein ColSpa_05712 [Colletotrichum spaethianum]
MGQAIHVDPNEKRGHFDVRYQYRGVMEAVKRGIPSWVVSPSFGFLHAVMQFVGWTDKYGRAGVLASQPARTLRFVVQE